MSHDYAHFTGRVEFASALPAPLGELADEVFVATPDDVGLNVFKPERLTLIASIRLLEPIIVEITLAVGSGIKVNTVDDALEQGFGVGDRHASELSSCSPILARVCG